MKKMMWNVMTRRLTFGMPDCQFVKTVKMCDELEIAWCDEAYTNSFINICVSTCVGISTVILLVTTLCFRYQRFSNGRW